MGRWRRSLAWLGRGQAPPAVRRRVRHHPGPPIWLLHHPGHRTVRAQRATPALGGTGVPVLVRRLRRGPQRVDTAADPHVRRDAAGCLERAGRHVRQADLGGRPAPDAAARAAVRAARRGPGPFGPLGNTIAGLDGIVALAIGVYTRAALPAGVVVRAERQRPHRDLALLGIVVAAAVLAVLLVKRHWGELLVLLSRAPLLGGIASALVVFFGLFPGMLYALNITRRCTRRGRHTMLFPVGIIVPARNEEGLIGDCVRAIDEAVADYPQACTVYVVENGSSDRTLEEARAAIREARHVRGVLLQCESKGKAFALNYGLRHVTEEIVLRIDADTLVTRSVLFGLIRHFGDPSVGGASGMPLPRVQESWICRMRALEVYYQVGFKRAGYNAVDAIGVLPGALVAYRHDLLVKLNGFAEGVNGEDADMTVRVGRLGYRIVSDASVQAYTEMPTTFGYL